METRQGQDKRETELKGLVDRLNNYNGTFDCFLITMKSHLNRIMGSSPECPSEKEEKTTETCDMSALRNQLNSYDKLLSRFNELLERLSNL